MENIVNNNGVVAKPPAPWWYKVLVVLWGPICLVGGTAAAIGMMEPPRMIPVGIFADAIQVVLLGFLINKGLKHFSVKRLLFWFLFAFLLMLVVPIIFIMIDTPGEITVGAIMFMVFLFTTVAQIIFAVLYGLARKILKSASYKILIACTIIHAVALVWFLVYLFDL